MDATLPAGTVGGESWPDVGRFCYPVGRVPNLNELLTNALVGWVRAIALRPRTVQSWRVKLTLM